MNVTPRGTARLLIMIGCLLLIATAAMAQDALPGGVTSRLKKINDFLTSVETRLKAGSVNRNDLDWAVETLAELKKGYAAFASRAEVTAAEKRIADVTRQVSDFEAGKKQKKDQAAAGAASEEKTLVDWAERLSAYKADSRPGSKGQFGIPTEDIEWLLASRAAYEEAKALYAEFLKSGLDKDAHHQLRQAVDDIRVAILNYESGQERVPQNAAEKLDAALKWMAESKTVALDKGERKTIALLVENAARLFPGSERVKALNVKKAELDRRIEKVDTSILENRTMRPDQYKGPDAEQLKRLAQAIVLKEEKGASVLKVNITSAAWTTESVVEWTDTTRTALQHRSTDSVNAQVAVRVGADCFLYTVFLNKDRIGGRENPLTGHLMFRDRLLEKNIR